MNDRDCESCKKFSRNDPYESEGYCNAKRTWVDPQEGEDCKMHEFTLHSATKYKDGTPIMSEPEKVYCDTDSALIHGETSTYATGKTNKNSIYGITAEGSNQLDPEFCEFGTCPYYAKFCDHTLQDKHGCAYLPHTPEANLKYLEQTFTEFAKTQDDLIAEYDETLKTHGETLEDHHERITINEGNIDSISADVEDLQKKVYAIYKYFNAISPNVFFDICKGIEELAHKGSDFCGNCTHCDHGKQGDDTVYVCELSKEVVDPDESSCSMFEPPF